MKILETLTDVIPKFIRILADRRITPDEYGEAADLIDALIAALQGLSDRLRSARQAS
jgi:hypothetical protein